MNQMTNRLTIKQKQIARQYIEEKSRILVLYGAQRSGKTYLAIILFLAYIRANRGKAYNFIIGGADMGAVRRNILSPMEAILIANIKLNQYGAFNLYGNTVHCFGGVDSARWKSIRGFTAKGALLNEATALNQEFIMEAIARCSEPDSRIFMDTNPDNPMHHVKTTYIDKSGERIDGGRINIRAHHFDIFDNEMLDDDYVKSMIASTPSGMFTDRNIWGKWVAAEGAIYSDFNEDNLTSAYIIKTTPYVRKFVGVDWGYKHKGVMVVWGVDARGTRYRIAEHAQAMRDIQYWTQHALSIKQQYGDIPFYCDHSRPENFAALRNAGIDAQLAFNPIMSGIAIMASLYKTNRILIPREPELSEHFMAEIYSYTYAKGGKDAPLQVNDDCMDADRYAVASDYQKQAQAKQRDENAITMLKSYGL